MKVFEKERFHVAVNDVCKGSKVCIISCYGTAGSYTVCLFESLKWNDCRTIIVESTTMLMNVLRTR